MIRQILEIAKNNPFGFTINLKDMSTVKNGYIVAYLETQNTFEDNIEKVIKHSLSHDKIIGGWLNEENKKFYFDSCKVFKDKNEAIKFGIENKQIAIFDLTNLKEIKL